MTTLTFNQVAALWFCVGLAVGLILGALVQEAGRRLADKWNDSK